MITPQPVSERALRRLRRRYTWLMFALGAPVLLAAVYLLNLQYEIVKAGAQRQLAMSADRRLAQIDGVLGRMREDLLRLGVAVRTPGLLTRDVRVDKHSLVATATGAYTLDALPVLLRDTAPQVLLVGSAWEDPQRRDAAVERAALFAEHAQLAMVRGGRFNRVTYVDVEAGEVWVYPWVSASRWQAELDGAAPAQALQALARRAGMPETNRVALEGELHWRVRDDAEDGRLLTLAMPLPGGGGLRFVAADAPLTAFDAVLVDAGAGRFWVVDDEGRVVLDHFAQDRPDGRVMDAAAPPTFAAERVDAALASPLALEMGEAVAAARASTVAPWVAFYASEGSDLRRRVLRDLWPYFGGGALLLLLFLSIAAFIWRQFGGPSLRLVDFLHRQAADPNAAEPKVPAEWVPWLQLTRDTFAAWREAAAREQKTEALKSAIVDHALAAVVTTDTQGLIVDFNPAAERMFSCSRASMIGRPAGGTIVADSLRLAYLEDLRRLRRGEAPRVLGQRVEVNARRPDGSEFPVDMVLWRTQVGAETFVTASLFDLSERRAAQQQIERQREALRQAEKLAAMGSLLAGVAHELNNPLAVVVGRASLLEEKCGEPSLRNDAVRIREAAERCARIVRTFLAMARSRPAVRAPVQLNDLVRGAVELLHYNLRSTGIALELELAPELPEVVADADQLGQVLLNLIVNAQQALAQAEPPRRLHIGSGRDARGVWLRVADNGPGVPAQERERIFDAFVTTKAEGVGTGLGLAVSRAVVAEHGGALQLEGRSPFGRGASFRLELPVHGGGAPGSEPTLASAALSAPAAAQASEPAAARVLVVDDEPELVTMMRDALESAGYEVASAESGALALALLDAGRFDAVVSDLRMPGVDGHALWRAIGERDPQLARRCVFVTGDMLSPMAADFRHQSGAEVLEKPFAAAELVQRVQHCLALAPAG